MWDRAESLIQAALDRSGVTYRVKEKDGSFYAPKIDIQVADALGREWQTATIQVDLVMLPERFDLHYIDEDGQQQRPVAIHRAIYGSLERFIGVITEHFGGAFPLWLAPVQAVIIPIADRHVEAAEELAPELGPALRAAWEQVVCGEDRRNAEPEPPVELRPGEPLEMQDSAPHAAQLDEDGYFWYAGRADDVIISAGYRIGPFEVESACLEHPAVAEAAAVASPDERRGMIVKAFIVLAEGHEPSDELADEIKAHVRKALGQHAYPRKIEFVDDLPKTLTGKIRRIELRERERA